jgi:nicotinamidase/pyrazinamidase
VSLAQVSRSAGIDFCREVDSYSAFFDNNRRVSTGLTDLLRAAGIQRLLVAGLAYDVCVGYTALHGQEEGFNTIGAQEWRRPASPLSLCNRTRKRGLGVCSGPRWVPRH